MTRRRRRREWRSRPGGQTRSDAAGRSSGRHPSSSTPRPSAKRSVIPLTYCTASAAASAEPGRGRRELAVAHRGDATRGVGEVLDQAAEQPDHACGLPARRRSQVDPLEVERPELGQRGRRRLGHADRAGLVDGVEHRAQEHADLRRRPGSRRRSRTDAGRSSGSRMPARTASSKSWHTYAMRSAQATTSPSGVDGAGRRHEWLRTPSSVSTQRLSGASVTSAP